MTFPNDNNKNLNPWVLQKNTYNRNGTLIYDITYNLNRVLIPSEIILDLDKNNWIMKMSSNGICEDEIDIITQLKFEECPFSIKFPKFNLLITYISSSQVLLQDIFIIQSLLFNSGIISGVNTLF